MSQSHSTVSASPPQAAGAAARSGYPLLVSILDGIEDQQLLDALQRGRLTGRPGYSFRSMWRAWLCKYILRIRYNVELTDRLRGSAKLREICGFDQVPSESTFCRFFSRLAYFQPMVERCLITITDQIGLKLPDLGKIVAVDSTAVETYGNPHRKTVQGDPCGDMDARWGVKHSAKAKDGATEYFFGYKVHTVADVTYGVPLGFVMTPGNTGDTRLLPEVVRKVQQAYEWLRPNYLLADRGYDSTRNHRFLMDRKITPVIHMKKPSHEKRNQGIYDDDGSPTCVGLVSMEYVRTDPETGRHLFRCPAGGCELREQGTKGTRHCIAEAWEDPEEQPRIVGALPRASPLWKALYKKRMGIERIFRSVKHSRNLERHCFRGMRKNLLHATLSMLTYSATLLGRLRGGDEHRMRVMRIQVT